MAGDQALVLRFKTDLAQAQSNLTQFAARAFLDLQRIGSAAIQAKQGIDVAGKAMELLSRNAGKIAIGAGIAAGVLVAVESIKALIHAAEDAEAARGKLNQLAAAASKAGVGTSFFQGWIGQAKELKLETSDLVAMLDRARAAATESIQEIDRLGERREDLRTGTAGGDRIKQNVLAGNLDPSALTLFQSLGTQEDRIRAVLGMIDELIKKGDQLAAFDLGKTFFGPAFEDQLRNGVDMVGRMRAALDGLESAGGERIIPAEEINRAKQMQSELDAIHNKIAQGMKPILDDIASVEQDALSILIKMEGWWAAIVQHAGELVKFLDGVSDKLNAVAKSIAVKLGLHDAPNPYGALPDRSIFAPELTVHNDKSKPLPSLTPSIPKETEPVETYIQSLQKAVDVEKAEADVTGARGNAEIQEMVATGVQTGMKAMHAQIARNIGPMMINWNNRYR